MQRAHDILVFALNATYDRFGIDANRSFRRAHIGVVVAVDFEIIAQDAGLRTAVDLDNATLLDRKLDRRKQPTDVVHGEIDDQFAVGTAFHRRDVEFSRREQIIKQVVARPVLILGEVNDPVRIEFVGRQRRLRNSISNTVSEVRAELRGHTALTRIGTKHVFGHVMLADCDLLHVVSDRA